MLEKLLDIFGAVADTADSLWTIIAPGNQSWADQVDILANGGARRLIDVETPFPITFGILLADPDGIGITWTVRIGCHNYTRVLAATPPGVYYTAGDHLIVETEPPGFAATFQGAAWWSPGTPTTL